MDQFDRQKELRSAMSGRTFLMLGGLFLIFTAVTTTLTYGMNLIMISIEAAKGTAEYVEVLESAGVSIALARTTGIVFFIVAAVEITCGVFGLRLSNRVDKWAFTIRVIIALLVVELLQQVFLFAVRMANLGMMFSGLAIPLLMLWGVTRFRRLAKADPKRIYAVDMKKNKAPKPQAPKKSLHERAMMPTVIEDEKMEILFVSDYVCPYCLVAKEALHQAIQETGITPVIKYQPYELTMEPNPQVDTWNDENRRSHYKVLEEPCKELGLDMKLPPHVIPRPYSRLAFEGYFYAKDQGKEEAYNDLVYRAYFIDEEDIGNIEVLCGLAGKAGLDEEDFRKALEEGTYKEKEREANRYAREELQIAQVPTIYVNGKKIDIESYTKEEFISILKNN